MITGVTLLCSLINGECNIMWETLKKYDTNQECLYVESMTAAQLNQKVLNDPVLFLFTCLDQEEA